MFLIVSALLPKRSLDFVSVSLYDDRQQQTTERLCRPHLVSLEKDSGHFTASVWDLVLPQPGQKSPVQGGGRLVGALGSVQHPLASLMFPPPANQPDGVFRSALPPSAVFILR